MGDKFDVFVCGCVRVCVDVLVCNKNAFRFEARIVIIQHRPEVATA